MTTPSPGRGAVLKTLGPEHFERARVMLAYERVETVVAELIATIDFIESRALPLPRRYTGGPLEDGLYLWREDGWREGYWESREVVPDLAQRPFWFRHSPAPFWLIGPITIPPIPESEEASS